MKPIRRLFACGLCALSAACAGAPVAPEGPALAQTVAGPALVDAEGMTLYTYDPDPPGRSTCAGVCALVWPPAEAGPAAIPSGDFSVIERDDGDLQWAYRGAPLYGYVLDDRPGDVTGDGAEGVWRLARP